MVTECTGGSATMSPAEEENDPWICGEWAERDTQFTTLKVEKNPERGWDVEAVSPLTHGAYIFKTTVYYDCEVLGFVYDKGKFWDAPTDGDAELGEARTAGTIGSFAPSIKSSGALSKEAFTASNITDFKVKFAPGRSFDNLLRDAEFEKTATLRAKAATLSAELKGEDTVDISKPDGNAGEEEEPEP